MLGFQPEQVRRRCGGRQGGGQAGLAEPQDRGAGSSRLLQVWTGTK